MDFSKNYLDSVTKLMGYYKKLGDQALEQVNEDEIQLSPNEASNSIAMIVQHMHGNMMSRWTNFLTEDGEKAWRKRDEEFEQQDLDKKKLLALWEEGWNCVFDVLKSLEPADLQKTITIRQEPMTAMDAINRQLAHYPYHVGQMIYIGKTFRSSGWKNLSMPKRPSAAGK